MVVVVVLDPSAGERKTPHGPAGYDKDNDTHGVLPKSGRSRR